MVWDWVGIGYVRRAVLDFVCGKGVMGWDERGWGCRVDVDFCEFVECVEWSKIVA